jgi:hypothetical protein
MKIKVITLLLLVWTAFSSFAQTGLSVSPPRLYFEVAEGQTKTEKFIVTNVSTTNELEIAISLGDWEYDKYGENILYPADSLSTSCAGWIAVNKDNYFVLKPNQSKEVEINLTVPDVIDPDISARTAMLFVTQMNPIDDVDSRGQTIRVNVRSGIKIYHRLPQTRERRIEIQNMKFEKERSMVELHFENNGNVWAEGTIYSDLINTVTGEKIKLEDIIFYTMPSNQRITGIPIPKELPKGNYILSVLMDYGDPNNMEAGELKFTHE